MTARCVYVSTASKYTVKLTNGSRVRFTNPAKALAYYRQAVDMGVCAGLMFNGMGAPRVGVRVHGSRTFDGGRTAR